MPNQTDRRWPKFSDELRAALHKLSEHPKLLHWFAENLDEAFSEKVSPLPLGFVFPDSKPTAISAKIKPPTWARPNSVLCAHRIREGAQWQARRDVQALASGAWRTFTHVADKEMPLKAFQEACRTHKFVLCVEGGGLDPCPKVFDALLNGAIPIVRASAASRALAELPVAFVESWSEDAVTPDLLDDWSAEFTPKFDAPGGYDAIQKKTSLDHWWGKILRQCM
ncbi:hypothetical protein [Thalassovita sp.]|uniref:hypothetical protein n=1 Tax=Thalassovita sp. TaxID=1979401 RepID=UPI002B274D5B|nr:hypothetical protein [Thalassovita sp.]